jgi:long-chain fatty acid transport protein
MMTGGMLAADDYARIEFADDSDFTGAAKGTGFAGKLGCVYQATPDFALGATYHLKTAMSDWEADEAVMAFYAGDGSGLIGEAIPGTMAVEDFQWPAVLGLGVAFSPAERWVLAADYKRIQWSDTMADFNMVFTAAGGDLDGETVGITFYQDWEDQSVFNLGAAFRASELLVLRGGAVIASNPIPDEFVNPLFPAIEENHFTGGLGLNFAERQALNLSFAVAPEVAQTNSNTTLDVTHSQFNFQMMYSLGF